MLFDNLDDLEAERHAAADRRLLADLGFRDDYSGIYVVILESLDEMGHKDFRPLTLQEPTNDFERKV